MSYTKTQWTNDTAPAINETNLNKIEQGIYDNDSHIGNLNNLTTFHNDDLVTAINEVDGFVVENNLLWDLLFDSANFFSTSKNYKVGDYTIYEHLLYKCTTAHSAGEWNSAHFTQSSVFVD
jgi:hypothetical protein